MPPIGGGLNAPKAKPKPKKKYVKPTRSPVGDSIASRKQDFKRAEKFKQTSPKYSASIRAAYRQGSLDSRRTQVARAQAKTGQAAYRKSLGLQPRSVEETAVLEAHRQRHKYYLKQSRQRVGDRPQDRAADFARAESFTGVRHLPGGKIEFKNPKWLQIMGEMKGLTPEAKREKAKTAALRSRRSSLGGPADYVSAIPVGLAGTAAALAEATYHDPVGVPVKTAKQAVLAVPAALGGAVEMARHPVKTTEAAAKDYFARVARESRPQKVKRIRKEGGFADLADLATAATGTGAATSAAARAAILSRVGERAAVRVSGGVVKSRPHSGVTRTAAGKAMDNARAKRLARDLQRAEAGGRSMDAVRYKAATANRRAGKTVQVVVKSVKSQQRRAVASERGKAVYRLRSDQKQRLDAVKRQINKLDKHEKRAFWYAAALGIRHSTPVEDKLTLLSNLHDDIVAGRESANIREIKGSMKRSDMLPDLDKIIANVDQHFTPKLSDVVEALRPEARKAAIEDPRLVARQANERRWAPLAAVLKVHHGEYEDTSGWRYHPPEDNSAKPKDSTIEGSLAALPAQPIPGQRQLPRGAELPARQAETSGPVGQVNEPDTSLPHGGFYEEVPGQKYNPDETRAQYRARVTAEAKRRGLAKPLYFKSERYVGPTDFAARALGGRRAMKDDFRYTGENLRVGLQDTSPDQYMRGLARNIKAKHNWESIANLLDDHAITGLTSPIGTTVSDLRKRVYEAGIDEGSVVYWNPGIFREKAREVDADVQAGDTAAAAVPGHELSVDSRAQELAPEARNAAVTRAALKDAIIGDPKEHGAKGFMTPEHLAKTSGWQAVPVEVMRELERQTTPSRAIARVLDVAKGKSSRAILLAGNLPWAAFQTASNVAMSTAATGGRALNPANWVGAAKWWKDLAPEERTRLGAEFGLDTAGADYAKTHLGASTNSDLVNAYRAMKAHPFWHTGVAKGRGPTLSQLNPLELMAAYDRKQNNAARVVTAFSNLKKETVREMGRNMSRTDRAQAKLSGILAKHDVREQIADLAKNPKLLEDHAEAVHDWLGDYTSMTSFERSVVNRMVMFYPYLRYSLKLTFYTMPMKHPLMTSILAELGSLRADELKQLLGGDRLYWNTGKVYFGSGNDVTAIDLRRANPALNALWDVAGSRNNSQLVGVLPPYGQMLLDQLFHRSSFSDREWRTEGKAADYGKKGADYGSVLRMFEPGTVRNRVLVGQVARMFYPYRTAVDRSDSMQGVQGDDSLLGSPRPIEFKGRTYVSKLKSKAADKQATFDKANKPGLLEGMVPFIPQPTRDFQAAKDQVKIDKAEKHPPKRHRKTKYFGAGGIK